MQAHGVAHEYVPHERDKYFKLGARAGFGFRVALQLMSASTSGLFLRMPLTFPDNCVYRVAYDLSKLGLEQGKA